MPAATPVDAWDLDSTTPSTPPGFRERYSTESRSQLVRRSRQGRRHVHVRPIDDAGNVVVLDIIRTPTSIEEHLASSVAHAIQVIRLDDAWVGFVPAHIGHSRVLDLAAKALVNAQAHASHQHIGSAHSSLRPYTESMSRLRVAIAAPGSALRDDTAITVALLALIEHLLTPTMKSGSLHLEGLYALMSTRGPQPGTSKSSIIAALYYDSWATTFLLLCIMGIRSPFDDPLCYSLAPVAHGNIDPAVFTLRWLSHTLFLRLPTLIALIRKIRVCVSVEAAEEAVALATVLLDTKDDETEQELLSRVHTVETVHVQDRVISKSSFAFENIPQYLALVYYWQTRLLLVRLTWKLTSVSPTNDLFDSATEDVARMVTHILRSWQYTLGAGAAGKAVTLAIVAAWGVLADFHDLLEPKLHGFDLRTWLLEDMNFTMAHEAAADYREMDQLTDLFAGGPLTIKALTLARGLLQG